MLEVIGGMPNEAGCIMSISKDGSLLNASLSFKAGSSSSKGLVS